MGSIGVDWKVLLAQIVNFVLLFATIGLIIWLIIKSQKGTKDRNPLDIVNALYAKGKITLEELEKIRAVLQKK